jgi:hypothetical protein
VNAAEGSPDLFRLVFKGGLVELEQVASSEFTAGYLFKPYRSGRPAAYLARHPCGPHPPTPPTAINRERLRA